MIGGLAVVSIYLTLLLPETSHIALPNTLDEALKMKDPKYGLAKFPRYWLLICAYAS